MKIRPFALFFAAVSALLLAGCESAADRRSASEEIRKSVPSMSAQDTFFDGRVVAHITLGSSIGDAAHPEKGPGGGKGRRGGGGGHHRGGSRGGSESMSVDSMEDGGSSTASTAYDPESSQELRARYVDSPMPPAMLRVKLDNASSAPITVEIHDLNSELGNFATRPDKFTLEPGASGEPGAMQSLLGVDSLALPVTLTLRVDGKLETKVLTLRPAQP